MHELSKATHLHTSSVQDGCVHSKSGRVMVVHSLGWNGRARWLKYLLDLLVQVREVMHVVLVPILETGRHPLKACHNSTFNIV